jgi:hypothetical protein
VKPQLHKGFVLTTPQICFTPFANDCLNTKSEAHPKASNPISQRNCVSLSVNRVLGTEIWNQHPPTHAQPRGNHAPQYPQGNTTLHKVGTPFPPWHLKTRLTFHSTLPPCATGKNSNSSAATTPAACSPTATSRGRTPTTNALASRSSSIRGCRTWRANLALMRRVQRQ